MKTEHIDCQHTGIKRPILLLVWIVLLLCNFQQAKPQTYGNEWIQYDQPYFRFKVYSDGIYKLHYSTLDSALSLIGIDLDNINPQYFQIWGRGAQQCLYIDTGPDGTFNQNDYISFYGKRNDGYFDSLAYKNPNDLLNPFTSLFSDTAMYFFSFNAAATNYRMTNEVYYNYSQFIPLNYVWAFRNTVFNEYYAAGKRFATTDPSTTLGDAAYTGGEGYTGARFYPTWEQNRTLSPPGLYLPGPSSLLTFTAVGGCNRVTPTQTVHLRANIGSTVIVDTVFDNYKSVRFKNRTVSNQVLNSVSQITFTHLSTTGQNLHEWISVPFIQLKYPRQLNFNNATSVSFSIPDGSVTGFNYLKISNINIAGNDTLRVYDLKNQRRIRMIPASGFFHALVPDLPGEENCYVAPDNSSIRVKSLTPVGNLSGFFPNLKNNQFIAGINYLMITNDSLMPEAVEYAAYRESDGYPETYKPLLLNVDDVYDQFAHGIDKNPVAIRNLARFAWNTFPVKPEFLFLIGKSYTPESYRFNNQYREATFVPVFGSPPSDWLFTMGLEFPDSVAFPVGRLSASKAGEVRAYLDKVKVFEAKQKIPYAGKKNILNFGGGSNAFEQDLFKYYLNTYTQKLTKPYFGGYVRSFFKTSPEPVQINQSQQLHDIIEKEGISVLNYFGHASGVSFDMSIGDPADFNNEGNYYFVLANSCWAGDIFGYHNGVSSERYVLIPEKGAIGYLASVTEGEPAFLHAYSTRFYDALCMIKYGKSIGNVVQHTINKILSDPAMTAFSYREVAQEFCLHADPAIILNPSVFPDYDITPSPTTPQRILFSPAVITAETDSFNLILIPGNNGKALDTLFFIRIQRNVGANVIMDTLIRCETPWFNDTLTIKLPVLRKTAAGENQFRITLDALQEIDENGMISNNVADKNLTIKSYTIIPVWPLNFAVIPALPVKLNAYTSDPLAPELPYVFELDTSSTFNSPVLQQEVVVQSGGLIQWNPTFSVLADSVVYFWRCTPFNGQPDTANWIVSSFQYIPQKTGWGQARFSQFKENTYRYINQIEDSLKFAYVQDFKSIFASTFITGHVWQNELFKLNGSVMDIWSCAETRCSSSCGMKFAVFDPVSFNNWVSYDQGTGLGQYGNKHCRAYPVGSFDFCTYFPADRQTIVDFIDTIPQGWYVLAFSHRNHRAQEYEESVYQAFESIGSGIIRMIQDTSPYIIIGRKGLAPGEALETGLFASTDSLVRLDTAFPTAWNEGMISSPLIGPALNWESLHWNVDTSPDDSVRLRVLGIRPDGSEQIIFKGISPDSLDVFNLGQIIPANQFPYLRLNLFLKDTLSSPVTDPEPAQFKSWHVVYQEVPETMVDPNTAFTFHQSQIQQGDQVKLTVAYRNISNTGMDSLLVYYWLESELQSDTLLKRYLRPHPAGDILTDSLSFSTKSLEGDYLLHLEINPDFDQPEYHHFNNYLDVPFMVYRDNIQPVLDVTFDGIHILNGDYVSASPEIRISLEDENPFLLLEDTVLINVSNGLAGENLTRLHYYPENSSFLQFQPAVVGSNTCYVVYSPVYPVDGTYRLSVQAADASGNASGSVAYNIDYKIRRQSGVSWLINYPNPFSDLTWFCFTVTGDKIPCEVEIKIYDPLGREQISFGRDFFGELHMGTNTSRIPWNGNNLSGNKLPSGIYPVEFRLFYCEGEIAHDPTIQTGPERNVLFFKNKLVILR